MAHLVIRNLDDGVKERLQQRAKKHSHSMEAEVREILRSAVTEIAEPSEPLGTRIASRFKKNGSDKPVEELRGWDVRVPIFEE